MDVQVGICVGCFLMELEVHCGVDELLRMLLQNAKTVTQNVLVKDIY